MPNLKPSATAFGRHLASGEGVYGLILVAGLIATAGSARVPPIRVLFVIAVTLFVFWLAHVFSDVVAEHGKIGEDGKPLRLRAAIRESVRDARGMLFSALLPALALLLGVVGLLGDRAAEWFALWICVAELACLGYLSFRRVGAAIHVRLLGALTTASFGILIIVVKAIVTH